MWAAGARGWSLSCRDMDMTDIKANADDFYRNHYVAFKDKQAYWKQVLQEEERRYIEELDEREVNYWKSVQYQDLGYG